MLIEENRHNDLHPRRAGGLQKVKDEQGESEEDMFSDWLGWMRRKEVMGDD